MDLALTEEQEMLKTAVRGFIQQEYPKETLLEMAAEQQPVTAEPWQRLAATGWLGIAIPQEYGGEGGSFESAFLCLQSQRPAIAGPRRMWNFRPGQTAVGCVWMEQRYMSLTLFRRLIFCARHVLRRAMQLDW